MLIIFLNFLIYIIIDFANDNMVKNIFKAIFNILPSFLNVVTHHSNKSFSMIRPIRNNFPKNNQTYRLNRTHQFSIPLLYQK